MTAENRDCTYTVDINDFNAAVIVLLTITIYLLSNSLILHKLAAESTTDSARRGLTIRVITTTISRDWT